jgi:hypothetical protein
VEAEFHTLGTVQEARVRAVIQEAGFRPEETHYDLPKPRTSFPVGHLTTGVAFAFPWHRDAWYSAPAQQINWWLPIFPVREDNAMSFDLQSFDQAVPNTSDTFDYYRNNASRLTTATQVTRESQARPGAVNHKASTNRPWRSYSARRRPTRCWCSLDRRHAHSADKGGAVDRQSLARQRAEGSAQVLSRRKIFKGAVGVAAVGAGGVLLADGTAAPARAAVSATTVESGAVAPAVVNLSDAATIAVDASLGNDFRVTIAGNRTVGTPANPSDGQKITFQVTQGTGGSFTLSWSSGYEFSAGLPQPTLSTTAGQSDLLGFIYNASKNKWLFVAFVSGFASTTVSQPPGTYRLFAATNGPSTPVSYSGPFLCGIVVGVASGGCWLDGYWWWVCPSGQSTAAQKFALWCLYGSSSGSLVPNSTITSGALTAGQWNYVPLAAPLPLAPGATYVAATGFSDSAGIVLPAGNYIATIYYGGGKVFYMESRGYFGSFVGNAGPAANGMTNGPLSSPSNANAFHPPGGNGCYYVGGTGPAYPNAWDTHDGGEHRWVDIEVTPSASSSPPPSSPPPSSSTPPPPGVTNSGAFLTFFP